jgi:hypothetical protein
LALLIAVLLLSQEGYHKQREKVLHSLAKSGEAGAQASTEAST